MSATAVLHLSSVNTRTLHHTTTKHNADVVHTLPSSASFTPSTSSLIVVGNYELHAASGTKVGGIALFEVDAAEGRLIERSYQPTSAVFDLQWCDGLRAGQSLLACADAAGVVSVMALTRDESSCMLTRVASVDVYGDSGASCLSVDWDDARVAAASASPHVSPPEAVTEPTSNAIATSSSSGSVSLLSLHPSSSSLSLLATCTPHSLEVWSCAFSPHCPTSLYSGGDDCLLCHVDVRSMNQPTTLTSLHTAGVCCVLPSASFQYLLATGCYDERLRLWDTRAMKRPLSEKRLNGGVWRLRWGRMATGNTEDASRLLCCCMHAGVQLVEVADGGASLQVSSEYYEHDSLAYGGDWVTVQSTGALETSEHNNAIVSCSFYDNSLRLWQPANQRAAAVDKRGGGDETVS